MYDEVGINLVSWILGCSTNFSLSPRRKVFLFECLFNEELDDYPDDYQVHLLPANLNFDDLPNDWTTLLPMSIQHLGSVPVIAVKFDQTLRKEIDLAILELLPTQQTVSVAKSA
jgi:hypothetical protein